MTIDPVASLARELALLGQLTACAQQPLLLADGERLVAHVAGLLGQHLPCDWGFLAIVEQGVISAEAGWGADDEPQHHGHQNGSDSQPLSVPLRFGGTLIGNLHLGPFPPPAVLDETFLQVLSDQIALLFGLHQNQVRERLATTLAAVTLDLVGQLDTRSLFHSILRHGVQLVDGAAGALYRVRDEGALELAATHGLALPWEHELALDSGIAEAVTRREALLLSEMPHGAASGVAVPLVLYNQVLGVLVLAQPASERPITPTHREMLETFAAQATLVLRNARMFEEEQQRGRELFTLYENSRVIESSQRLDSMLDRLAENIALALQCDRALLYQQAANGSLDLLTAYSSDGVVDGATEQPAAAALPLLADIARQGMALTVQNTEADGAPAIAALLRACGMRSVLLLPLKVKEQSLGVLCLAHVSHRHGFTRSETNLAQTMAGQLAAAISNAALDADKRRRIAEIELLHTISCRVNEDLALDETLRAVLEGVGRLVLFEAAAVSLLDDERHELVDALVLTRGGERHEPHSYSLEKGLKGWLARHCRPLRLADVRREAPVVPGPALTAGFATRSYLGVPLLLDGQFVGAIEIASSRAGAFDEADERLLAIVASQTAQAISNTRRYQQSETPLRARVLQLAALQRVGRQLTSTLFLPYNLEFVLNEAVRATRASSGLIVLRGTELLSQIMIESGYINHRTSSQHFQVMAAIGYSDHDKAVLIDTPISADDEVVAQVLKSSNFVLVDEAPPGGIQSALDGKSQSLLAVPIFYEAQVVGLVALLSAEARVFDHDALEFVRALADHTALAIGNAQRYEEQKAQRELLMRRANMLNEVLQIGQALRGDRSLLEVLEQIAFGVIETTSYRTVLFYLLDPQDRELLRVAMGAGMPLSDLERLQRGKFPVELALRYLDPRFRIRRCYFVPADDAQQIVLGTADDDEANAELNSDWQPDDMLVVPLYSTVGQLLGMMTVGDPISATRPTSREVEPLEIFADQAAIGVENAALLQEARSNAEALESKVGELSTLLEAARVLSSSLNPNQVLSSLMQVVGRHLQVSTVALWTVRDNILTPSAMLGIPDDVARTMRVTIGTGLTGRVAAQGLPLIIEDVENDGLSLYPSFNRVNNLHSYLGVPVSYQERTVGVLSVMTTERRRFSEDEVALLSGLADQAAIALENARLFAERERQLNELTVLNEIGLTVTATLDQQDVLERLHGGIGRVLDVSTSVVALYDAGRDTLTYPIAFDRGKAVTPPPLSRPRGAHGWVLRQHSPLLVQSEQQGLTLGLDVDEDHYRPGDPHIESLLVAPITAGRRVLGLVSIQSYEQFAFSEDDLRFVSTVATQAAAALENARLFAETRQSVNELQLLYDNSLSLARTLDSAEAQQLVVTSAAELLRADLAALFVLDAQGDLRLHLVVDALGNSVEGLSELRSNGLNAELLRSDSPLAVTDYNQIANPDPLIRETGIRGLLGVVIGTPEQQLGTLWLATMEPRRWSERQISLLSIFATQASQAIENARLFQSEQAKRRLADTLRQMASTLTSTLALDEIQQLIFDQLAQVVPYDSAAIMLREEQEVVITACSGFDQATTRDVLGLRFSLDDDPHMAEIVETRRPLMLPDAQLGPDFIEVPGTDYIRGWIGAPLLVDNEVIGILTVDSHKIGAYSDEDAMVAFALASQGAQAIRNGRLFAELKHARDELELRVEERTADLATEKERLEVIHRITLELTATLDLEEILMKTLKLISGAVGVSRASIMLRDPAQGELICRAVLHENGAAVSANQSIRFDGGEGLAGWVMRHQEPVLIPDVRQDERWVREDGRADDIRSLAAVPLISADEPLGVLILSSLELAFFSNDHLKLLATIANEVAIAIYNAELYSWLSDIANKLSEALTTQREENSKTFAILRSVSEGVIVLDERGLVALVNPAAEQVLGITSDAVAGQPFDLLGAELTDEGQRERLHLIADGLSDSIQRAAERAAPYAKTLDVQGQTIAVNVAPVVSPDGTNYGTVAVLRDITREIEADRIKREFVSTVSHELRTPLTSIRGYVDLLLMGTAGPVSENQLAFLSVVKTNTSKLMDLINDILAISTIETDKDKLQIDSVEIDALIREVYQSLKVEFERKSMTVTVTIAPDLPTIEGDRRRITQVVTNLFSNAVKYTYTKGRIDIRAYQNPSGMLQVDVQDNGVGISTEQQKLLFSRFYRADNPLRDEAGGTGLGLSIAKSYVEKHGGEMWVSSGQGEGSTFSFVLPLTQPRPQVAEGEEAE